MGIFLGNLFLWGPLFWGYFFRELIIQGFFFPGELFSGIFFPGSHFPRAMYWQRVQLIGICTMYNIYFISNTLHEDFFYFLITYGVCKKEKVLFGFIIITKVHKSWVFIKLLLRLLLWKYVYIKKHIAHVSRSFARCAVRQVNRVHRATGVVPAPRSHSSRHSIVSKRTLLASRTTTNPETYIGVVGPLAFSIVPINTLNLSRSFLFSRSLLTIFFYKLMITLTRADDNTNMSVLQCCQPLFESSLFL